MGHHGGPPEVGRVCEDRTLTDCVAIRQNCHSGRAQRWWARPVVRHTHHPERSRRGIQERSENQIILDAPAESSVDDEF